MLIRLKHNANLTQRSCNFDLNIVQHPAKLTQIMVGNFNGIAMGQTPWALVARGHQRGTQSINNGFVGAARGANLSVLS